MILERYITKIIVQATALSLLIIMAVLFLMLLLGEMKSIGEGDYTFWQAILYILMRLPNELYQFSPMLILLGSITGVSILSSHRELAVMRASGFSSVRLIKTILTAALLLILFLSLVGEVVGPRLSYKAEIKKENAQNAGQAIVTSAGVLWFHLDNNFIHIERVISRQLLEGVTNYQFNNHRQLQATYYAKKIIYQNKKWIMKDVVETLFYPERTKSRAFPEGDWNVKINLNLLTVGLVDPQEMTLPRLVKFAHYLENNDLQAREYWFDFWRRLFQPFADLMMVLLALPFVFRMTSTTALGWRLVAGILIGFVFFISNALLEQLTIVYQVPAILAASLPVMLFLLIAIFLVSRRDRQSLF